MRGKILAILPLAVLKVHHFGVLASKKHPDRGDKLEHLSRVEGFLQGSVFGRLPFIILTVGVCCQLPFPKKFKKNNM